MILRVLLLLTLFPLCAVSAPLPVPDQGPALRIQGSNTIGAALGRSEEHTSELQSQ